MKNWNEVEGRIKSSKHTVILSHRSPDGDSVGSSLALYHYLKNYIGHVQVITPDPAPKFLSWLSGFDSILNYQENEILVNQELQKADLICCLDFNTPSRMGDLEKAFQLNQDAYVINIDHHQDPDDFANFQISETSASSTCQLIYDFIDGLNGTDKITKELGEAMYTGIVTDTGSFRFSSTSKHTHNVVAELIEVGINPGQIHESIYNNYSIDRLKLLGFALDQRFNVYENYNAHIKFYVNSLKASRNVEEIKFASREEIMPGKYVLVSEKEIYDYIESEFTTKIISQYAGATILHVSKRKSDLEVF